MKRPSDEFHLGKIALRAIRHVIERTIEVGQLLALPGEGDERPFRNWLKSDVLIKVFGWPDEKAIAGEIFDILLLDEFDHPVVYIETKPPYHRSTQVERSKFMNRLSNYPTLKSAFYTDGLAWERYDLISPEGKQEVHSDMSLDISQATNDEAESFFTPLRGDRYFHWGDRNRSRVTRAQPHILEELARDIDIIVSDIADCFSHLFDSYEIGEGGLAVKSLTRSIFDDWCHRSLQASPSQVLDKIQTILVYGEQRREPIVTALRDFAFTPRQTEIVIDRLLAMTTDEHIDSEKIRAVLFILYKDAINKLCVQSAHVVLARVLVYRIGEDIGLFEPLLGGNTMETSLTMQDKEKLASEPNPALSLLWAAHRRMIGVLPIVYQLSDLDWWYIPEDKKIRMSSSEVAQVDSLEKELDRLISRTLRILDGYFFSDVDADVWRNVYQNYLPEEERQRIGGFYTPQELVEFILDHAGYVSTSEGLCNHKLIDLACGSGAFVAEAAVRLLKHLSLPLPCHEVGKNKMRPEWLQKQELLEIVLSRIHAIDIHPFAAFLTTLNLTFLLLPDYAKVHRHVPTFTLEFNIFSTDALEKPTEQIMAPSMFEQFNSRIQLTAKSYDRYRKLINARFDMVCGNPPWGGILKGMMSPVFDENKKRHFRHEYPNAAVGKYDIYGLFIERSLQILAEGGIFAMVTQDTYLDKEWAKNLRRLLATKVKIRKIIDLNPFGQLFFKAMNTPCITIFDNVKPDKDDFIGVITIKPGDFKDLSINERRKRVLATVQYCLDKVGGKRHTITVDFSTANLLPLKRLRDSAMKRWNLSRSVISELNSQQLTAADVFEPRQGVTPGGSLDIFLMSEQKAKSLNLESELVYRAIKTRDTEAWHLQWKGLVLLYPYTLENDQIIPAFTIKKKGITDSLDFEACFDENERNIVRGKTLDNHVVKDLLEHRISLGLVKYPEVARYLIQHYLLLDGRIFKKKRMKFFGRRWYEYIWPRDPQLMVLRNRIVSPRLARQPRFSLDTEPFLSDDSCQYLLPTMKTYVGRERLRSDLHNTLNRDVGDMDILLYCLAFLNSPYSKEVLVSRGATPKGSFQISEKYLAEIPVIVPSNKDEVENILANVRTLIQGVGAGEKMLLELRLANIINKLLGKA